MSFPLHYIPIKSLHFLIIGDSHYIIPRYFDHEISVHYMESILIIALG